MKTYIIFTIESNNLENMTTFKSNKKNIEGVKLDFFNNRFNNSIKGFKTKMYKKITEINLA